MRIIVVGVALLFWNAAGAVAALTAIPCLDSANLRPRFGSTSVALQSDRGFGRNDVAVIPDNSGTPPPGVSASSLGGDPVMARVREHVGAATYPLVRVVGPDNLPRDIWHRVKHLVAFRIHRHSREGTAKTDPVIYLLRTSDLYDKAAAALRMGTTHQDHVWCLLVAVLAHESAHNEPHTERQALTAEIAQLRLCLFAGHPHASDGWNLAAYFAKVEAKLRNPREHY
jgi:hypothetical protein